MADTNMTENQNPDHHLWNNNGTWFVHFTRYPTPVTKERVRKSLKTKDLEEARKRRDVVLLSETSLAGRLAAPAPAHEDHVVLSA